MSFSADAWQTVRPWYRSILTHPFVASLQDGSLPLATFRRYLLDDAHYLAGFARALAAASVRVPDVDGLAVLAGSAQGAVVAERTLHRDFLRSHGIDPDAAHADEPSPTCVAYVRTLLSDALVAPVEVAVAGLVPCFRVYREVGTHIAATGVADDHPYRRWIDTYADDTFDMAVRAAEELADRLAERAGAHVRGPMLAAYVRSTRFEWMFWDASWRGESWPEQPSG